MGLKRVSFFAAFSYALFCMQVSAEEGLQAVWYASMDPDTASVEDTYASTIDCIDFNWGSSGPAQVGKSDYFSARFVGGLTAPVTGEYQFLISADDGVRLWVDGTLMTNRWHGQSATWTTASITLNAEELVSFRLDYFEKSGGARIRVSWIKPDGTSEVIPASAFTHQGYDLTPGNGVGLARFSYLGHDLTGDVIGSGTSSVNFSGSPDGGITVDDFSNVWIGQVEFLRNEETTLTLRGDDGIRLWVDNRLVIDGWRLQSATNYEWSFTPQVGRKYPIRIEHFERGGGAVCQLFWSSHNQPKQIIPAAQLYPLTAPVMIQPSRTSYTSPLCVEGVVPFGLDGHLLVDGDLAPVESLGRHGFYVNVDLDAAAPTEISDGSTSVYVEWLALDLAGMQAHEDRLQIRQYDTMRLIAPPGTDHVLVHRESGYPLVFPREDEVLTPGQPIEVPFDYWGTFVVEPVDILGESLSSVTIDVVGVGFTEPVALGLNKSVSWDFGLGNQAGVESVHFESTDPVVLDVQEAVERSDSWKRVTATAASYNFNTEIVARLGQFGPIIGVLPVYPFQLHVEELEYIGIRSDGFAVANLGISPWPLGAPVQVDFWMFAHGSRFAGGADAFSVITDGGMATNGQPGFTDEPYLGLREPSGSLAVEFEFNGSRACFKVQARDAQGLYQAGEN